MVARNSTSQVIKLVLLLALFVVYSHAKIEFTRFYSDPLEMMMQKPSSLSDLRYQRIKNMRDEKLKRRRAVMPIRITPFYYSMTPVEFLDSSSVGSSKMSGLSPFFSSYYGGK